MAIHAAEMRRCLIACDVSAARKLWQHIAPHLPQPKNDADALVSVHIARTQMDDMPFKLRAYSHRWLTDNGWPSGLPDHLKPKAERIYPRVVEAVGISYNTSGDLLRPIVGHVRRAMKDAVLDAYSHKNPDPKVVKAQMFEAKRLTIRKLLGL